MIEYGGHGAEIGHDFQAVARELPLNGLACAQVSVDVGEPESEN